MATPSAASSEHTARPADKRPWRKPVIRVHGDLATLTRAKNPNGVDSGLGTEVS
jgi:hypothetical protein